MAMPLSFSSTISEPDKSDMTGDACLYTDYHKLLLSLPTGWRFDFQDLNDISYDLNPMTKEIIIHNYGLSFDHLMESPYFAPQAILAMVSAVRMTSHSQKVQATLGQCHPQFLILIKRICEADSCVHKIRWVWEERNKSHDHNVMWKHILCSDLSDLALQFERTLETFFTSGYDSDEAMNKAMAVIFNQWFSCEDFLKDCDHTTLNMMDEMIESGTEFKNHRLKPKIIRSLTKNDNTECSYIDHSLLSDLMDNPYYRTIHDPINNAHFMQCVSDINTIRVGGLAFHDVSLAERFI